MRKIMIAGNWKMNNGVSDSIKLINDIKTNDNIDILVSPTFVSLYPIVNNNNNNNSNSNILVAAQNMHYEESGAFTGEISPTMLKDINVNYVILGHSERRHIFKEDDALIREKVLSALKYGLKVILCIGELIEEREANKTDIVLEVQLTEALKGVDKDQIKNIIIAYEPVWAIGTGKVATPEQAQQAHHFCRAKISELYNDEIANQIRILYGGSLKPENAKELLEQSDIDGGLIGGASLKAESFNAIIDIAKDIKK
ncbi:MAG: triose-phosphate isomerase [Candidatus Woesearchaeota archaeon]